MLIGGELQSEDGGVMSDVLSTHDRESDLMIRSLKHSEHLLMRSVIFRRGARISNRQSL